MCRHTTVPGLVARLHQRIPVAAVERRQAQLAGTSVNVTALKPRSAFADHPRAEVGIEQPRQLAGDEAVGICPRPLLQVPVVPGPHGGQPEVAIRSSWSRWPANPGRDEGKLSEAYTPLISMSWTRAWMSHAPLRMSSNRVGSKLHSATGRPTTAFNPTLGSSCRRRPTPDRRLSFSTTRGARSANCAAAGRRRCRAARRVIVDRDQRVAAWRTGRLGQERDRALLAGLAVVKFGVSGQLSSIDFTR